MPWLMLTDKGGLLCQLCINYKTNKTEGKGAYSRSEWTVGGVFCSGSTREKQLTSLRVKLKTHKDSLAHKRAVDTKETVGKEPLPNAFQRQQHKYESTTARLMRTAYSLAKNSRPLLSYPELCELQEANGTNLGTGLHSRFSATGMIDCIAEEMRSRLCKEIIKNNQKLSIIIDESTTVSRKSCLLLYIRTRWPQLNGDCFSFPLELIELSSLTAEHIFDRVLLCLSSHGFNDEFLSQSLIGACSDGASTMLGSKSGVLTRLKAKYPTVFLWHCLCHRVELSVGDAVNSCTQVNHVASMIDKLYSTYSQSPKAQRELDDIAGSLGIQLQRIGKVFDVRWAASSYQTLSAVWQSYPALHSFFSTSAFSQTSKHRAVSSGLKSTLAAPEFVHSLAVLLDALEEVSNLSLTLQAESCSLSKAYRIIKRTIRALQQQKEGAGPRFKEFEQALAAGAFKGVSFKPKGTMLNRNAFLQALVDNLSGRLFSDVSQNNLESLLADLDVLDSQKWPSCVESPWLEGENNLKSLCDRFSLDFSVYKESFRDYIDEPTKMPKKLMEIAAVANTLPVTSADCERGFSTMNNICSDDRNRLLVKRISNLIFLSLVGPPVSQFQPSSYVKLWLRGHRSADDTRTRVASQSCNTRYERIWKLFG